MRMIGGLLWVDLTASNSFPPFLMFLYIFLREHTWTSTFRRVLGMWWWVWWGWGVVGPPFTPKEVTHWQQGGGKVGNVTSLWSWPPVFPWDTLATRLSCPLDFTRNKFGIHPPPATLFPAISYSVTSAESLYQQAYDSRHSKMYTAPSLLSLCPVSCLITTHCFSFAKTIKETNNLPFL